MDNINTDCNKCGAPMPEPPKGKGFLANIPFKVTVYRCQTCEHWNNLKRRKPKKKTK